MGWRCFSGRATGKNPYTEVDCVCYPEGYEGLTEQRRTGYPQLFKVFVNNSGGAIDTNIRIRRLPYPSDIQKTILLNILL